MMNLYLHTGLNKTGSSFLQTVLVQNRSWLIKQDYYFPIANSRDETNMLKGEISAGNGAGLNDALLKENELQIELIFSKFIKQARKNNCKKVLVSNERLFVTLSDSNKLKLFEKVSKKVGFQEINALTILREPMGHIMSMYKHRSKKGKHSDFSKWMQNDYETVTVLSQFIERPKNNRVNWSFRKYQKNGQFILTCFFKDWLDIPIPKYEKIGSVNTSLTMSEIIILQNIFNRSHRHAQHVSLCLSQLPSKQKAKDGELEQFYKSKAFEFILRYRPLYESFNTLMPVGEKLKISLDNQLKGNNELNLSTFQIEAIFRGFCNAEKLSSKLKFEFQFLKSKLFKMIPNNLIKIY